MFTGLVEELGTLVERNPVGSSLRLLIKAEKVLLDLKIDDSISVNGCCQTVIGLRASGFEVIAVEETLKKTTLGSLKIGDHVNLERAATLATRMAGHLVQGHIDGVAHILKIEPLQGSWNFLFELPEGFGRYCIPVGSIAIDGVSLTIAEIAGNNIRTAIIPHTYEHTNFHLLKESSEVNIELDMIAKMVEKFTMSAGSL